MWMERRANLARQALRGRRRRRPPTGSRRRTSAPSGAGLCRRRVGGGLHRADPPGRPEAGDRAFHAGSGRRSRRRSASAAPATGSGSRYEEAGDAAAARGSLPAGRGHQTSFYGQLAAEKLASSAATPRLAGTGDRRRTGAARRSWRPRWCRRRCSCTSPATTRAPRSSCATPPRASRPATRAALAQMAIDLGRPQIGIRIAKDAAADGIIIADQYYPLHPIAEATWPVPTEFAMAIARQESELDASAASSAGARGLMQLMPATAEHMAESAGVRLRAGAADRRPDLQRPARHRVPGADARPLRRLLRAGDRRLQRRPGPGRRLARGVRRPARRRASTR